MHDDISTHSETETGATAGAEQPISPALAAVADGLPRGYMLESDTICISKAAEDPVPICGPVRLLARARSAGGCGWALLFRFQAMDGAWRDCPVAARDLSKSPGAVVALFVDQGFAVRDKRRTTDLLGQLRSDELLETLGETGWIGSDFAHFITPSGTIVSKQGGTAGFVFTGTARHTSGARGTLDEWRANVVGGHPPRAALIGACAAIAPVTLAETTHPSFILHLFGNEPAGRIARNVASSVWGAPGCLQLSWQDPVKKIVAAIAAARDGLVILSGYTSAHARKLAGVAEALQAHDATAGRVVVLSTGADPITGGARRLPTQSDAVVIVDLDTSDWDSDGDGLIARAAGSACGHFGPAVAQAFIAWDGKHSGFLSICCDDILDALVKGRHLADDEMRQAAHALGALFGAGKMAANRKLWDPANLKPVFVALARAWAGRSEGLLSPRDRTLIAAVARGIADLLDTGALTTIDGGEDSAAGWFDDRWFYLTRAGFQQVSAQGEETLRVLHAEGLLQPGNEPRSLQYKVTGPRNDRLRVYRISRDIIRYDRIADPEQDAGLATEHGIA